MAARETLFTDVFGGGNNPHANYDVAPDGAHLLLLKAASQGDLVVVTNWGAFVRKRMAGGAAK